ncbi:MAG: peptidylprolyl isomerase [Elusimicrobiota bacterium]|jgi:peptidyl-prolyl cis-trans isomerase A (cyclophilin A)
MKRLPAVLAVSLLAAVAASAAPSAAKKDKKPMPATKNTAALLDPSLAKAKAPETFKAKFATTQGDFTLEIHRAWSPLGADRFYNLVNAGYYDDAAFFRVIKGFMVQFGINGSGAVNAKWREARINDDPASGQSNTRGMVSFAMAGPNTRTTQVFINYADNGRLDSMGFTPFAKVASGMDVVDKLYGNYGEGAPSGSGPHQGQLQMQGNAYLKAEFPKMDYVRTAVIVK